MTHLAVFRQASLPDKRQTAWDQIHFVKKIPRLFRGGAGIKGARLQPHKHPLDSIPVQFAWFHSVLFAPRLVQGQRIPAGHFPAGRCSATLKNDRPFPSGGILVRNGRNRQVMLWNAHGLESFWHYCQNTDGMGIDSFCKKNPLAFQTRGSDCSPIAHIKQHWRIRAIRSFRDRTRRIRSTNQSIRP